MTADLTSEAQRGLPSVTVGYLNLLEDLASADSVLCRVLLT